MGLWILTCLLFAQSIYTDCFLHKHYISCVLLILKYVLAMNTN